MASTILKSAADLTTARVAVVTAAANKQTIVITGTVSNLDTANKASHFVTIEIQTGGTYRVILKDAPVPYGGSLILPKIAMVSGDVMHMTASANSVMQGYISYVEKD